MAEKVTFNIYRHVTDSILAMLERGTKPWVKPWDSKNSNIGGVMPVNHKRRPYSGINVLILWSQAAAMGYSSNVWMTYKQAAAYKANVRKGEKGTGIVYYSKVTKDKGTPDESSFGFLKSFWVFNIEQIENLPESFNVVDKPLPVTDSEVKKRNSFCDDFAKKTGIRYAETKGNKAFYQPSADSVVIPLHAAFKTSEHYYSTLWHEFVHATGHKSRLDRNLTGSFGDSNYAFEELIAEMGSAFLCAATGVSLETREDHAAYLASWIKGLKNDPKAIFKAASMAAKASNYLLNAGGINYEEEISED